MFNVLLTWGISWPHNCSGNLLLVEARVLMKCTLKVWMACSAALTQWLCGSTKSKSHCSSSKIFWWLLLPNCLLLWDGCCIPLISTGCIAADRQQKWYCHWILQLVGPKLHSFCNGIWVEANVALKGHEGKGCCKFVIEFWFVCLQRWQYRKYLHLMTCCCLQLHWHQLLERVGHWKSSYW